MKFIKKNSADLGPIVFFRPGLPVLHSDDKDDLLTPEENEEAFQVYMHRRMLQAHGLPPGPIKDGEFGPKKD